MASNARPKRRAPRWAWLLIGIAAIAAILFLSPIVALLALAVFITAVIGFSRGTRTWLRLKSRPVALGVAASAVAAMLVSGSVSAAMLSAVTRDPETMTAARLAGETTTQQPRTAAPKPTPTPTPEHLTREEVVTEAIAFEQTTHEDATIPRGQTKLTVAGQNGERTLTYRVTTVDGVETERELVSDVVTVEPIAEATAIGVYDPPPPPPVSNCDSNYAEACVPIASDVDCAGGSGNGPAYFDGVARVVGSDVYDLDADGDGYACEPW